MRAVPMRAARPIAAGALAAVVAAGVAGACRDAPELAEPPELPPLGPAPYQLTFDPGKEVSPTWSASGEEVIYVDRDVRLQSDYVVVTCPPECPPPDAIPSPVDTLSALDTVFTAGIVRAIPREGGVAERLLPNLQGTDPAVVIDFAAQASTGRLALFNLLPLAGRRVCDGGISPCDDSFHAATAPRLVGANILLREPGPADQPGTEAALSVEYAGRTFDMSQNPLGLSGAWLVDRHPFQERFIERRRVPDRLSWAPDGDRLVFSDGLALHVWTPASGDVTTIPGSEDGVDPAWSPTGDWIAFHRTVRGGMVEEDCEHRAVPPLAGQDLGEVLCVERRRTWTIASSSLALIRPDGSDLRLLPEGGRPAWGPEGARVYYEGPGSIWSVGIDGEDVAPVPGTDDGLHPAVSPDGRWLAFTRPAGGTGGASDIWIAELEP